MRIIEVKAYHFRELSEEAKAKVLEDQRYVNVRFNDWHEIIIEAWKCSLEGFGFFAPRIYFSGFYSQGDGASFECNSVDIDKVFDSIHSEIESFSKNFRKQFDKDKKAIYDFMENYVSFRIETLSSRYCHENTRQIEWDFYGVPDEFKYLEKFMDEIGNWLESKRKEFSVEIYRQLEEEYEDSTSDKAVINAVNSNEYEFLEDGRLIDFPQSEALDFENFLSEIP